MRRGGVAEPEEQGGTDRPSCRQPRHGGGRREFAPERPGPPEWGAGQGSVEATDGDGGFFQRRDDPAGGIFQRRVSLFLKNFKRTPPAASCGVLN